MKQRRAMQKKSIESWSCDCGPEAGSIPVYEEHCPYCFNIMPQNVRTQIYRQVSREIRGEIWEGILLTVGKVLSFLFRLARRLLPIAMVLLLLFVLIWGGGWLVRKIPVAYEAVSGFFADVFSGPVEFFRDLRPEETEAVVSSVPWETEEIISSVPEETKVSFGRKIAEFFGSVGEWFRNAWEWIRDLCSSVGSILKKLWNGILWVIKLIAGIVVILFTLAAGLVTAIIGFVKWIFSLF